MQAEKTNTSEHRVSVRFFVNKKLTRTPFRFRSTGIVIIVDPIKAVGFRVASDCADVVAKWYVVIWTVSSSKGLLELKGPLPAKIQLCSIYR